MKKIWTFFKEHFPMYLFGSLAVTLISVFFIVLVDADSVVSDLDVLFGMKCFQVFTLLLMWLWAWTVYQSRGKEK